jgi:predicted DNA-binding WGR domain protein
VSVRLFKSGASDEPRLRERVSVVRHDVLMLADVAANNNKFFSLELHESAAEARACIYTHYGRVGDAGRRETRYYDALGAAKLAYNDLFQQKTKKGYELVQLKSASIGSPLVSCRPPRPRSHRTQRRKREKKKKKLDFSSSHEKSSFLFFSSCAFLSLLPGSRRVGL